MKRAIDTGIPPVGAPFEWAVTASGMLYTAQIPIRADGTIETGDIRAQTRLTLDNLKQTMEAAGGTLDDVTQVMIYITDAKLAAGMNEVYKEYFSKPYPNRATVVAGLLVPGMDVEMLVHAQIAR